MLSILAFIIIGSIFNLKEFVDFIVYSDALEAIRAGLLAPVIMLWMSNLIIWEKRDKKLMHFILLFFLNAFYSPVYSRKVLKNEWV